MKLTVSLDILEEAFYYVSPVKPVSTVPLVYATFLAEKTEVAYTTDNEAKFARKSSASSKPLFTRLFKQIKRIVRFLIKTSFCPLMST